MDSITLQSGESCTSEGMVYDLDSLYAYLERVSDPRKPKGVRYRLATLLLLMLLAKLAGQSHPTGMTEWLEHRQAGLLQLLKLQRHRLPHHCTLRRVLADLEPEFFEQVISTYQKSRMGRLGLQEMVISIDGKTLRGTIRKGEGRGVHLLAAYLPSAGVVLMEVAVGSKENEIVAAPKVLKSLDLNGVIVIGDALHTQRKISAQIVEAGGDYLWTVKGNQAHTEWAIRRLFADELVHLKLGQPLSQHCQIYQAKPIKGHGRIECYTLLVSQQLNEYLDWPYVAQVFCLIHQVWHDHGKRKTREIVYGLTSLSPQRASPHRLLTLKRGYWGIENGLHRRRDVSLCEDATRATVGHTGHNLAILNNLAIALSLSYDLHFLPKAQRLFDAKPEVALRLITSGKSLLCE
ncbi:MAG: ISAs1 family transposase [Anaerolineaceae bacterium]|nr:ISAs1 family transposase [Anaerolineaceae bacterium]